MNPIDAKMRAALGVIITIGFFGTVATVLFVPVPATVRDIVLVLIGALIASFKDVTTFFFGTSAGSAAKDETIKIQAANAAPLGATNGEPLTVKIDDSEKPVKVQEASPELPGTKPTASMRYTEAFDEAAPGNQAPVKEQSP